MSIKLSIFNITFSSLFLLYELIFNLGQFGYLVGKGIDEIIAYWYNYRVNGGYPCWADRFDLPRKGVQYLWTVRKHF